MSRPKKLSEETRRITVELGLEVFRYLKVQSALRDTPVSLMVEEIIRAAVPATDATMGALPMATNPLQAAMALNVERFPVGWDGIDINQRLYRLGRTQKDLATSLGLAQQTLNRWCQKGKIPPQQVGPIQNRLQEWATALQSQGVMGDLT